MNWPTPYAPWPVRPATSDLYWPKGTGPKPSYERRSEPPKRPWKQYITNRDRETYRVYQQRGHEYEGGLGSWATPGGRKPCPTQCDLLNQVVANEMRQRLYSDHVRVWINRTGSRPHTPLILYALTDT